MLLPPSLLRMSQRALPVAWTTLLSLWLASWLGEVGGLWRVPTVLVLGTVLAWLLLSLTWMARGLVRALARPKQRRRALTLYALIALALAVRLLGIGHELEQRSYLDEGTYYQHARSINDGQLLQASFVYPHALYYADALVLWTVDRLPVLYRVAGWIAGSAERLAQQWLFLRLLVALSSAATMIAVFAIAERITRSTPAGDEEPARSEWLAPALAALFFIFSPLFNQGSHLIISDFPSACLATVSLAYVARLLDTESSRDYALAGAFAGLAAATKYPAGVVAVAIPAVWLLHRWRTPPATRGARYPLLALAAATGAALAVFVALLPGLLVFPHHALFGRRGMLYGLRQYAGGGWLGVVPDSNLAYYGTELARSFGWAALLPLALAPLLVRAAARRRVLWMLPFPLFYLTLITSMNMVVRRNLAPVVPLLAALCGVGAWGLLAREREWLARWPALRTLGTGATLAALLAAPVLWTSIDDLGFARATTLEQAQAWIERNVPRGASILKEQYSPRLDPGLHRLRQARFATRVPLEEMQGGDYDYLLLASKAYARYLDLDPAEKEYHQTLAQRYQQIFDNWQRVATFTPGGTRHGGEIDLFRIPLAATARSPTLLHSDAALVADAGMVTDGTVRFLEDGQWASYRVALAAGTYRVQARGPIVAGGQSVVLTVRGDELAVIAHPQGWTAFDLPQATAVLFDFQLPPGSVLFAVGVEERS